MEDPKTILVVEDSMEDFEVTRRAFERSGIHSNVLVHCEDGDDALDYLRGQGRYSQEDRGPPRPAIVLLDLKLPGTDGLEVLKQIRANESLRRIPVIVVTTSADERDIEQCYARGANTYIQKPMNLVRFFEAIARLHEYWFETAILPKGLARNTSDRRVPRANE